MSCSCSIDHLNIPELEEKTWRFCSKCNAPLTITKDNEPSSYNPVNGNAIYFYSIICPNAPVSWTQSYQWKGHIHTGYNEEEITQW